MHYDVCMITMWAICVMWAMWVHFALWCVQNYTASHVGISSTMMCTWLRCTNWTQCSLLLCMVRVGSYEWSAHYNVCKIKMWAACPVLRDSTRVFARLGCEQYEGTLVWEAMCVHANGESASPYIFLVYNQSFFVLGFFSLRDVLLPGQK